MRSYSDQSEMIRCISDWSEYERTGKAWEQGYLILSVNTLYRFFCFIKLFPMVGKGLSINLVPRLYLCVRTQTECSSKAYRNEASH